MIVREESGLSALAVYPGGHASSVKRLFPFGDTHRLGLAEAAKGMVTSAAANSVDAVSFDDMSES
ncbi:hypothetical protein DWG20_13160 [Crenobacter cavernae]|uniref:Uncharacterized protein n=1 Tax=Crenobacter cavernae TaxID=2290923 RepID=A0A345Y8Q1_9NEIS|nr:hypothetical protein DWG20_13160 [Crenobacter cavernae]